MERIITPKSTSFKLKDFWHYRELFYFLVWRDIKVRYKQTVIGILWVIVQPFATMVVFTFLFGTIAKIGTGDIPYPIFTYAGLLFWNFFAQSVRGATSSLVENRALIGKVYFPRIILPISASFVNLVDFFVAFSILIVLMIYFQFMPQIIGFILVPFFLLLLFLLSVGTGAFLASLNVFYRDIRFVVSFALQILMFLTPVVYPITAVPEKFRFIVTLNPLTPILEAIRASFFNTPIDVQKMGFSLLISFVIFLLGTTFFMRKERYFADVV